MKILHNISNYLQKCYLLKTKKKHSICKGGTDVSKLRIAISYTMEASTSEVERLKCYSAAKGECMLHV